MQPWSPNRPRMRSRSDRPDWQHPSGLRCDQQRLKQLPHDPESANARRALDKRQRPGTVAGRAQRLADPPQLILALQQRSFNRRCGDRPLRHRPTLGADGLQARDGHADAFSPSSDLPWPLMIAALAPGVSEQSQGSGWGEPDTLEAQTRVLGDQVVVAVVVQNTRADLVRAGSDHDVDRR